MRTHSANSQIANRGVTTEGTSLLGAAAAAGILRATIRGRRRRRDSRDADGGRGSQNNHTGTGKFKQTKAKKMNIDSNLISLLVQFEINSS